MTPRLRKFALTAHVTCSVGWLGSVAAFLALAVAGIASGNAQTVRAAYLSMDLIGWFVIVPLSFASLFSGLVQSLGTEWGLFRHYWILVKLLLNVGASVLLLLHMQPTGRIAAIAAEKVLSDAEFVGLRIQLLADAGAAVLVLLVATTLSVYRPWGLTRYGRRKQDERRYGSDPIPSGRLTPVSTPWGRYVLFGIFGLLVLVVVVHLMGGGLGGH